MLACLLVIICEIVGVVKLQPLKWSLVSIWFPVSCFCDLVQGREQGHLLTSFQVNLIFVGMIGSSFFALKEVGVGMVGCVHRGGRSADEKTNVLFIMGRTVHGSLPSPEGTREASSIHALRAYPLFIYLEGKDACCFVERGEARTPATGYGVEELEQFCHRRGRRCHLQKKLHRRRMVRPRICSQNVLEETEKRSGTLFYPSLSGPCYCSCSRRRLWVPAQMSGSRGKVTPGSWQTVSSQAPMHSISGG